MVKWPHASCFLIAMHASYRANLPHQSHLVGSRLASIALMVNAAPKGDRPSSSSQRPPVSDLSLVSVLRDEMKVERDYYRRDEILLSDPPNDFELDDTAGKNSFFLLKVG